MTRFHRVLPGEDRRPDFLLQLDREQVALEVVRFIDERVAKAEAGVGLLERALKERLDPLAVQMRCKLALDLTFDVIPLQTYGRKDAERDAELLAPSITAAAAIARDQLAPFESAVPWVASPAVFAFDAPADPSFFVGSMSPGHGLWRPDAGQFVAWVIEHKGRQHVSCASVAILAVQCEADDSDTLIPAFAEATDTIPWWRVYIVWGGGDARLVHGEPEPRRSPV